MKHRSRFRGIVAAVIAFAAVAPVRASEPALEPPSGFASTAEALAAIQRGEVPLITKPGVPETVEATLGIEYAETDGHSLKLDVYRPRGAAGARPALMFIHGGGWEQGHRDDYRYYCVRFAELGYVTATISYRFSDVATFPGCVDDARAAALWLRDNAAEYGIDPDKIVAIGGSAGGYLAMMTGYVNDPETGPLVCAVVNFYGPTDLTVDIAREHRVVKKFMGVAYGDDPGLYHRASPLARITADAPPTLILHGTADDVVPIAQADALAARLATHKVPHAYVRLDGWPHTMDLAQTVNDYCMDRISAFLDEYAPLSG